MKSLVEILSEENFEVQPSNERYVTRCPFHEGDNTPSFTIYPNDTYYCWACEVWGDGLKFLVEYKGWTVDQAREYLGDDYTPAERKRPKVIKIKNTNLIWEFLYEVADKYHRYLMETPGAIKYLLNRGLTEETIKKYKLGYSDGAVLKLKIGEVEISNECGITAHSGYELMSHRITIPNLLDNHYCDFITGRTIVNDKPKYLNTTGYKPIHGFYEVRHSPILFVAEGQFDWLTLRQWGIPAAVMGGSHLKKSQYLLFKDRKIVIVPDYDENNHGMNVAQGLKNRYKNSVILDYKKYFDVSATEMDISSIAALPGANEIFYEAIMKEVPWLSSTSTATLEKWFPNLVDSMSSRMT